MKSGDHGLNSGAPFGGCSCSFMAFSMNRWTTDCAIHLCAPAPFTTRTASQLLRSSQRPTSKLARRCRRYISIKLHRLSLHRTSDELQIKSEAGWQWPIRRERADLRRDAAVIRAAARTRLLVLKFVDVKEPVRDIDCTCRCDDSGSHRALREQARLEFVCGWRCSHRSSLP